MKLRELLDLLYVSEDLNSEKEICSAVKLIIDVQSLSSAERDTLVCCFERSPVESGDIPSKSGRDSLVTKGFVVNIIVKGEQGYTACTYKGSHAYKILKHLND